jgi:uncharacterized membrane protein YhaH (DUF805 family)
MSKPVFDDILSVSGRRNRLSYTLFFLACLTLLFTVTVLFVLVGTIAGEDVGTFNALVWLIGTLPLAWASLAVTAQRCRDLGWSGWLAILGLVPYVGFVFHLALAVLPGIVGANRYGPDPISRPATSHARLHPRPS